MRRSQFLVGTLPRRQRLASLHELAVGELDGTLGFGERLRVVEALPRADRNL